MSKKKKTEETPKPDIHAQLKAEIAAKSEAKTEVGGEQDQRGEKHSEEPEKASKSGREQIRELINGAAQPAIVDEQEEYLPNDDVQTENDTGSQLPVPEDWGYSLERMNAEWSLVLIGSKVAMVREQPHAKEEDRIRVVQVEAFHKLYSNKPTQVHGGDGKIKNITWSKRWEGERYRRQFDGIEFYPNPDGQPGTRGYLNLWQGFSYQPDPGAGSWSVFKDHMLTNICAGDADLFNWVFGWFAHMLQTPRSRPGTALVVRGLMGTGKSIMGEVMGSLIAPHFFQVDDPRYITGQFNAHMSACLLLQAEEAVWAGDKVAEGRLKGLITSKTQMIESKGVDPYRLDNYVRIMMTSNEDWVVPAGKDERRYCVLDCAPHAKENHEYFGELVAELDNGGRRALLADLLSFDLSSVNLRQIPRTGALLQQKLRSLDSVDQFLFERLHEGTLLNADETWCPDPYIIKQKLYEEYLTSADRVGIKRRADLNQFGKSLLKLIPNLQDIRPRDGGSRRRAYIFPGLADCRAGFEAAVGQAVDWPIDPSTPDLQSEQSAW
ncbi:primase-helicase family protein [Roseibium album]|uniref:primase-helicase family protein n=1 Tax=Roseibium album TaxID=311410 RepID=UPI00391D8EE3